MLNTWLADGVSNHIRKSSFLDTSDAGGPRDQFWKQTRLILFYTSTYYHTLLWDELVCWPAHRKAEVFRKSGDPNLLKNVKNIN